MVSAVTTDVAERIAFVLVGLVMIVGGVWYFRHSRRLAVTIAARVATAPAWQRLWLPPLFWSESYFFFQLRATSAVTVVIGCVLLCSVFVSLHYPR